MFKKQHLQLWIEKYLFYPHSFFHYLLSYLLLPFSLIYCIIVLSKRLFSKKVHFCLPVVSVGNLTVGGSGKTPFLIALTKERENIAIVLRGYKRASKGLHVVSNKGEILCDVDTSGDEAMLYAKELNNATVIVSEKRETAIEKAIALGAEAVFLDDGFSKAHIEKLDILLRPQPEPANIFCLPSGPYREPRFLYSHADIVVQEDEDFMRKVQIQNPQEKMLLITGIAKPQRLDAYLDKNVIAKVYFEDHHMYTKKELETLLTQYKAESILTTKKDAVKMESFNLPLSILDLQIQINPDIQKRVNTFLANFR